MRTARLAPLAALLSVGLALAQGTPPQGGGAGETALQLKVGERASLCPCPVSRFACDDPALVKLVEDAGGQSMEGAKPGTTLCSLYGPNYSRRLYRVTVLEPDPAQPKG